ncbi:MAG: B12-binding domain-containing radical SAM protein [Paenibacillaceae bacterium]|nr:B12-binding domain-containing radical SAM protein [Paenibacillaceae bacterium]
MCIVVVALNAKFIHMSLALRCIQAHCAPTYDVHILEYTIHDPPMHIVMDVYEKRPTVIGFSVYIWNVEQTIAVVRMLRKVLPDALMCLGGPEVSYDTDVWMNALPEVDVIVQGEGEETFRQILETLDAGRSKHELHDVRGCVFRDGDQRIVVQPQRPKVPMDALASPVRRCGDDPHVADRVVYVETSRGCPFSCQFCLSSIESGVRFVNIDRIKADLLYVLERGATVIKFVDRTFNINKEYALSLFQFLAAHHGGRCVFQFEITADILHPDVLEWLVAHAPKGVFRFEIGVQSTNDRTNALVKRKQRFDKLSRTVVALRESERVVLHLDLIAGLPEEDEASFQKTFDDVFALRPHELQLGFLKMLRGTGLRRDAQTYGYVVCDSAPYEVLGHASLPFEAMIRIKRAEHMLEVYWNARRTPRVISYVCTHWYASAFVFFRDVGTHWHAQGWTRIGHQLYDVFVRLWDFVQQRASHAHHGIIKALLMWDYAHVHRMRPRKLLFAIDDDVQWKKTLHRIQQAPHTVVPLPHEDGDVPVFDVPTSEVALRTWRKSVVVSACDIDMGEYVRTGRVVRHDGLIVAVYAGARAPYVYAG